MPASEPRFAAAQLAMSMEAAQIVCTGETSHAGPVNGLPGAGHGPTWRGSHLDKRDDLLSPSSQTSICVLEVRGAESS